MTSSPISRGTRRCAAALFSMFAALAAAAGGCSHEDTATAPCSTCAPEDPRPYDVLAYDVRGAFDDGARVLAATVDITLRLTDPARAQLTLDSRVQRVDAVTVGGNALPFTVDTEKGLLLVDAATAVPTADGTLTIRIAYQAALSDALRLSSGRDGDPLTTRALYTTSEPTGGSLWLPGNHRPADRARFAVELEVNDGEDVIANGTRVSDVPRGQGRHAVRYATDFTIPTYLMAFAEGDLVHEDDTAPGEPPIAVWHRRGAAIESAKQLDAVRHAMRIFAARLGPYPFPSYALVLLPEHPGGMENATITFVPETSGQTVISFSLDAHELGHHWFGDYVTVNAWEDVWIKEGMATLLAEEAARDWEDARTASAARLFGDEFAFNAGDAIRDRATAATNPEALYTSGPYSRAAWLLTQIRSIVGEEAFWGTLRGILAAHAFGTVSSDDMIAAFAPLVGPQVTARIRVALDATGAPTVSVGAPDGPNGRTLTFAVDDPSHAMVAPLAITTVDAQGTASTVTVDAGGTVTVPVPEGGYVAPDERDVHPEASFEAAASVDALASYLFPNADGAALDAFFSRSIAHEEHALSNDALAATPDRFVARYARLGSDDAKLAALRSACASLAHLAAGDAERDAWVTALTPLFSAPSNAGESFLRNVPPCGEEVADRAFAIELTSLLDHPNVRPDRLSYVMNADFAAAASFDAFAPLATEPANAELRDEALVRLVKQADPANGRAPVTADEAPRWKAFFRDAMARATSFRYLRQTFYGARALNDAEALPILAQKMTTVPIAASWQTTFVCGAWAIAGASASRDAAWQTFVTPLSAWSGLADGARAALKDPTTCGQ